MRSRKSAKRSISAAITRWRRGRRWLQVLPGPTGESNELRHRGRGVFVCISPWNFPLAIFLGQVTAALVAGNAVVAKSAEQTPLVAAEAVRLLHRAGVPASALQFLSGVGPVQAAHVGPVIDEEAKQKLDGWLDTMAAQKRVIFRWDQGRALPPRGLFVPPSMIALDRARDLQEEVFGPILHVVRWRADRLDALL